MKLLQADFILDSEWSEGAINFTKIFTILFFIFVSVTRVASRELLRSSTIEPFSGRKTYILLCMVLCVFSKCSKSVPKRQKNRKNGKRKGKRVFNKIDFVIGHSSRNIDWKILKFTHSVYMGKMRIQKLFKIFWAKYWTLKFLKISNFFLTFNLNKNLNFPEKVLKI